MKGFTKGLVMAAAAAILCTFLISPSPSFAQGGTTVYKGETYPMPKVGEPWEFSVAPYGWLTGYSGKINVGDRTVEKTNPYHDIGTNWDGAGGVQLEARKGRWGAFLQPNYVKVSPTANFSGPTQADIDQGGPGVRDAIVRFDSKTFFAEFGGFFRLWQAECPPGSRPVSSVDVLAGGRYWYVQNHAFVNLPDRGVSFDHTSYADIIDPIVGFRTFAYLAPRFFITLRGDAGGFGASSNSSHVTWNAVGAFGYDICPCASITAGYRYIYVNYSGNTAANFRISLQGPTLGFAYRF
jgi:hypothetical protein